MRPLLCTRDLTASDSVDDSTSLSLTELVSVIMLDLFLHIGLHTGTSSKVSNSIDPTYLEDFLCMMLLSSPQVS
jgi:hypothetical protein